MLGQSISDPDGIEGPPGTYPGLGLLDVTTNMFPQKNLRLTKAKFGETGAVVEGYEIHVGDTDGPDRANAWLTVQGQPEGAASPDGRIRGTYLHGLFSADQFRADFLTTLGASTSGMDFAKEVDIILDRLAEHIERHLDLDGLLRLAN